MAQAKCENGHIFDSDIYGSVCPYCDHGETTIDFGSTKADAGFVKSVAETSIQPEEIGGTVAPGDYLEKEMEKRKTVGVFKKQSGLDPVVGWLVCVVGGDKGKDYRLEAKTNSIGRGEMMDVRIKGDDTITSDTHAKIDYDILNNNFYLIPANNKNTIYMNKAPVYAATMLNPYDTLRFGQTELLFVPFCCDKFQWPSKDEESK